MINDQLTKRFQVLEDKLNETLISNNSNEISKLMSNDWVILEPQMGLISKERFLKSIDSGSLQHTAMKKEIVQVKVHNDIAIVTTRGKNIGSYLNEPFNSEQWVTNTYKKENENWICIMTQEAPVSC